MWLKISRALVGSKAVARKLVILCLSSVVASSVMAQGKASAIVFPTRVVLEDGQRSANINLVNRGTASGAYRISIIDSAMTNQGNVQTLKDGMRSDYSIKDFVRFSPRRTELGTRDNQNIKVMIRPPKDLPEGEYFSHLKILVTSDNLEEDNKAKEDVNKEELKNMQLKIRQRSAVAIPIIYRHGSTKANVELSNVSYSKQNKVLAIDMLRNGNESTMGDILVDHVGENGIVTRISEHMGKAIYANIDKREFREALRPPKGTEEAVGKIALDSGSLHIQYVDHNDQSILLAQTKIKL